MDMMKSYRISFHRGLVFGFGLLWDTKLNKLSVFDETSKQQDRDSRLFSLDQYDAMAGQGGGAG